MGILPLTKLVMDDECKNESDAYQVAFYKIGSLEIEKVICNNIEQHNCNKFRILDLNWLKKQDLLSLPDVLIMRPNTKLTKEEDNLLTNLNIKIRYIDENILTKPASFKEKITDIELAIYKAKSLKYLEIEKNVIQNLEDKYTHIPADNEKLTTKLVDELVKLIKEKDDVTYAHIENVSSYVDIFIKGMPENKRLSEKEINFLKNAALVHDTGKLIVPNQILRKAEKLDDNEYHNIKRHVREDAFLFNSKLMEDYKDVALAHHERYDGTGYPKGLKGEEIPYFARIISVLDAFEAMTGNRAYVQQNKKSLFEVLRTLQDNKGTQFDPEIVDFFVTGVINSPDFQKYVITGGNVDENRHYK